MGRDKKETSTRNPSTITNDNTEQKDQASISTWNSSVVSAILSEAPPLTKSLSETVQSLRVHFEAMSKNLGTLTAKKILEIESNQKLQSSTVTHNSSTHFWMTQLVNFQQQKTL